MRSRPALSPSFSRGISFAGSRSHPSGSRDAIRAIRSICRISSLLSSMTSQPLLSSTAATEGSFRKFRCSLCLSGCWWCPLSINTSLPISYRYCLCLRFSLSAFVFFALESLRMRVVFTHTSYIFRYTAFLSNRWPFFSFTMLIVWAYASSLSLPTHPFASWFNPPIWWASSHPNSSISSQSASPAFSSQSLDSLYHHWALWPVPISSLCYSPSITDHQQYTYF